VELFFCIFLNNWKFPKGTNVFCSTDTEWQHIVPSKSLRNFLSNVISCRSIEIYPGFDPNATVLFVKVAECLIFDNVGCFICCLCILFYRRVECLRHSAVIPLKHPWSVGATTELPSNRNRGRWGDLNANKSVSFDRNWFNEGSNERYWWRISDYIILKFDLEVRDKMFELPLLTKIL